MLYHGFHIVRVHGVEDGVEVLPVRVSPLGILIHQILHNLAVIAEVLEDVPDPEFIVVRDVDELAVGYWKQCLFSLKD